MVRGLREPLRAYTSARKSIHLCGVAAFAALVFTTLTANAQDSRPIKTARNDPRAVQSMGDQGVFPSDARAIFESLGAADKTFQLVRGAHYFEGDDSALKDVIEVIAAWTTTHTT